MAAVKAAEFVVAVGRDETGADCVAWDAAWTIIGVGDWAWIAPMKGAPLITIEKIEKIMRFICQPFRQRVAQREWSRPGL